MERLRRRVHEQPATPLPRQPRVAPEIDLDSGPEPATVQVIWGPLQESLPVAGMTVASVRELLQGPLNIPGHAVAALNGRPVSPRHRLAAGEVLEFIREAGEKGDGR